MDTPANPVAEKPRRFKKLRICLSAVFLLLALAFAVLWVRSYWCIDRTGFYLSNHITSLGSEQGGIFLDIQEDNPASIAGVIDKSILGFGYSCDGEMKDLRFDVPTWFLTFGSVALAYAPWFPWSIRYRLRTLFIVMTAVAVLLGLGVWLARS